MKRLHEGWDYKLYQIYVWGGMPLIVIYILVAVLVFEAPGVPGSKGFLITIGPMLIWFTGLLIYWWWVFLFKGNKELEELVHLKSEGVPNMGSLKSWNTLHQAMSISGGNTEELIRNAKKANIPIIIWFGAMNVLPIWIFAPIILGSLNLIPGFSLGPWIGGVFFWIVFMLVLTYFLLGWGSKTAEKAYLAPLGLAVSSVPAINPDVLSLFGSDQLLIPESPAVVEGERFGRMVHIETLDKFCLTFVQTGLPVFTIQSNDGKLETSQGKPEDVVSALRSLRKAKRWRGINVHGGPAGVAVHRESKGTNMWLYDLWLAEYLIEQINNP